MPGSARPVARKTLPSCNSSTPSKRSSASRSNAPYLFRSRHGIWYFRVVVPERARAAIDKHSRPIGAFREVSATAAEGDTD